MRIAFLGKGGSGKTTLSALFALYADSKNYKVGLIDVDVNSHTADVLGVGSRFELSEPKVQREIRQFLAGENPRVKPGEMLNTTPPGRGSNFWSLSDDNFINKFATKFGKQALMFTLGSYKSDEIGHGCHHGTQGVAQNMLSHLKLDDNEMMVIDSVAGNDSFANSLYLQDVLVFVVKPEREGLAVFERYYELAKEAGVGDRVRVLANQVMSPRQAEFLRNNLPKELLIGEIGISEDVVDARLDNTPLSSELIPKDARVAFDNIIDLAKNNKLTQQDYYDHICKLHRKVSAESWVFGAYRAGLEDQIDKEFVA